MYETIYEHHLHKIYVQSFLVSLSDNKFISILCMHKNHMFEASLQFTLLAYINVENIYIFCCVNTSFEINYFSKI